MVGKTSLKEKLLIVCALLTLLLVAFWFVRFGHTFKVIQQNKELEPSVISPISTSSRLSISSPTPSSSLNQGWKSYSMPVVIASCLGNPPFRMSLPKYSHLKHWLADASLGKQIHVGDEYLYFQNVFKKFPQTAAMIDVGCNHGLAALPVAVMGHQVFCFEPVKYNVEKLQQSKLANELEQNLVIVHSAVGAKNGEVEVYVPTDRDDNASLSESASIANLPGTKQVSEKTSIVKLDDWFDKNFKDALPSVAFIKIDVQGFEEDVILGAKSILEAHGHHIEIQAELSPRLMKTAGKSPTSFLNLMHSLGFNVQHGNHIIHSSNFQSFASSIPGQVDLRFFKNINI